MKIIILLGIHGSGKGEQMRLLVNGKYVQDYISTGEVYEKFKDPTSRYHKYEEMIKPYEHMYAEGSYFPDELTMRIVKEELEGFLAKGCSAVGMEGFPRNTNQAKTLEKVVKEIGGISLEYIYLDLPDDIAKQRIANRGKTEHRATDAVDDKRIALYHEVTDPMIKYLHDQGLVQDVDDRPPIEVVHQSIVNYLK